MSELFETFDDAGSPTGRVERSHVHAQGLWHKSSHIFLFAGDGRLLVQQRAADKDLYADCWDYSVGEHLIPGETHLQGAERGLLEELGVTGVALESVGGVRRARFEDRAAGIRDFEIQQAFRGIYDGPLRPDPIEVQAVEYIRMPALVRRIGATPEKFTPWFAQELETLGFI